MENQKWSANIRVFKQSNADKYEKRLKMDKMRSKILLTNIQRFSLHDGPGIRTTVFLKGCSLRCPWCSNPENLLPHPQEYEKDGIKGVYGKWYEVDELVEECLKDKNFYEGKTDNWAISTVEEIDFLPGGVTFSGGEALLQMEQLVPVCEKLKENGVHIAVETCLFVPEHKLTLALNHIDFFYCDIKILNAKMTKELEHGNLELYLRNFEILMQSGKPVVVRVPVIGNRTDNEANRKAVKELLERFHPLKVELIKEHNLGESKYKSLGMEIDYRGVSDELMKTYKVEIESIGVPVEICRI